jgi:hypothetical protein
MEEFREVAAAEKEEQRRKFEQTERSIVTKRAEPVRYLYPLPTYTNLQKPKVQNLSEFFY